MVESLPDRTAALHDAQVDPPPEMSKNALKKAAKQEKLAAEKAHKSATTTATQGIAKAAANKPTSKGSSSKGKIEGKEVISIDVSKEEDFAGWYQQVLTKGDMLDYYDVSGCYILKV